MSTSICKVCGKHITLVMEGGKCKECYNEALDPIPKDTNIEYYPEEVILRNKKVAWMNKKENRMHLEIPYDRIEDFSTWVKYDIIFKRRIPTSIIKE